MSPRLPVGPRFSSTAESDAADDRAVRQALEELGADATPWQIAQRTPDLKPSWRVTAALSRVRSAGGRKRARS